MKFNKNWFIIIISLVLVFSFCGLSQAAEELVLWYGGDLVEQTPQAEKIRQYWEERWGNELSLQVNNDYGPIMYDEMKQKFIIQGRNGKPDLIRGVLSNISTFSSAGLIAPLKERFNAWEDSDKFFENVINAITFKGEIWAIPVETNARVLLYRKDIFEKYNLDPPKTWDELLKTAQFITKNEPGMYGLMLTSKMGDVRAFQEFISWFYQLNNHFYIWNSNKDSWELNATKEQLAKVLGLYYSVINDGEEPAMNPDTRGADYKMTDYDYTLGKFAMVPMGPWIWKHQFQSDQRKEVIKNTGITPLPVAEGGHPGTYLEVESIMLNAHSKNIDQAWEMLKMMTDKDSQEFLLEVNGALPSRKDVVVDTDSDLGKWLQGFKEQLPTARALAPVNWEPTRQDIVNAMQLVLYAKNSPEEAAEWLYNALQNRIEQGQL